MKIDTVKIKTQVIFTQKFSIYNKTIYFVFFSFPQVRELESRLSSRETEFERYRQQIVAQPESKLQAELSIAQLEKVKTICSHFRERRDG